VISSKEIPRSAFKSSFLSGGHLKGFMTGMVADTCADCLRQRLRAKMFVLRRLTFEGRSPASPESPASPGGLPPAAGRLRARPGPARIAESPAVPGASAGGQRSGQPALARPGRLVRGLRVPGHGCDGHSRGERALRISPDRPWPPIVKGDPQKSIRPLGAGTRL
jgi:hypothetical protein